MNLTLEDGFALGGKRLTRVTLRQVETAAELIAIQEESEKITVVTVGEKREAYSVSPDWLVGLNTLRRQVASISGEGGKKLDGPLTLEQLGQLSKKDLMLIQAQAGLMDEAFDREMEAVFARLASAGRPEGGSAAG